MEDDLVPYPKKVRASATNAGPTTCVSVETDVPEPVSVSEEPPTSPTILHQSAKDAWETSDIEERDAFWQRSSSTDRSVVEEPSVSTNSSSDKTPALSSELSGSDTEKNGKLRQRSRSSDEKQTRQTAVGNITDDDAEKLACRHLTAEAACSTIEQTTVNLTAMNDRNKLADSIVTSTSDSISTVVFAGCDKYVANSATAGVSAMRQIAESNPSFADNISNASESFVSEANKPEAGNVCFDPAVTDAVHNVGCRCRRQHLPVPNTVCKTKDETNTDTIIIDPRCDDQDPEADVHVVDDTDDSDVDEMFMASRPSWCTAVKKDPYPVKEQLVLSLEEVLCLHYCLTY